MVTIFAVSQFRLTEDTYTIDEVTDLLDGLVTVVRGEVDTELIHTSHTNVLLLIQLFQQAEKWHLKLQADISELENRFDIFLREPTNWFVIVFGASCLILNIKIKLGKFENNVKLLPFFSSSTAKYH